MNAPGDLGHILSSGPGTAVPMRLRGIHRRSEVGDRFELDARMTAGWPEDLLDAVLCGAGFERSEDRARCAFTLADSVGPDMSVLLVGLNPSPSAAESGVGFAGPTNRFWKAAITAGLVTTDRDPEAALADHGVGMTDLVKRTTVSAKELTTSEYRSGLARLEVVVAWLRPALVSFVGLSGWRAAADRTATVGLQPQTVGGRPVMVIPNPSGLNAHVTADDLAGHFAEVARLAAQYCR